MDKATATGDTSYIDEIENAEINKRFKDIIVTSLMNVSSTEITANSCYLNCTSNTNMNKPLPDFSVKPLKPDCGPGFAIKIKKGEDSPGSISSTKYSSTGRGGSIQMPLNWAHDFTFSIISNHTDQPLIDFFPSVDDNNDNITPDLIVQVNETTFCVFEFTTRETSSDKVLKTACQEKFNKYLLPLSTRKDSMMKNDLEVKIHFGVISVGLKGVCSNFHLNQDLVDELTYRLRFAYSVEPNLEPYGIQGRKDAEKTMLEKRCAIELSSINFQKKINEEIRKFPEYSEDIKANIWDSPVKTEIVESNINSINEKIADELNQADDLIKCTSIQNKMIEMIRKKKMILKCLCQGGCVPCSEDNCPRVTSFAYNRKQEYELERKPSIHDILSESAYRNVVKECEILDKARKEEIEIVVELELAQEQLMETYRRLKKDLIEKQDKAGKKKDKKSLIQFPYLPMKENCSHPKYEVSEMLETINETGPTDNPEARIWHEALSEEEGKIDYNDDSKCPYADNCCAVCSEEVDQDPDSIAEDCPDLLDSLQDGGVNKGANDRSLYGRVSLDNMSQDDRLHIALQGVDGKKFADHPAKIQKEKESRESYSPFTDVTDIEEFIQVSWPKLFLQSSNEETSTEESIDDLLKDSALLTNNPESVRRAMSTFSDVKKTNLMRSLSVISDISMELNMSLKQHCKKNQFILKRIKNHKIYLLIRPTNSSGHLFYSILWDESEKLVEDFFPGIFKSPIKVASGIFCTEFSSTNKSKLSNQITCFSKLLSVLFFYMNENKLNPDSEKQELPVLTEEECCEVMSKNYEGRFESNNSLIRRMAKTAKSTLLAMLVILNDKAECEEHLTMIRHICMEGFVALPRLPNPMKMISKMKIPVKCRFTIWIQQKNFLFMSNILAGGRFLTMEEMVIGSKRKKIVRKGMHNYLINEPVDSEGELINMFYIGYGVNKNQTPSANVIGGLYTKILEWEELFDDSYIGSIGIKEYDKAEEYRDHEYSCEWIKTISDHALNTIKKIHNMDPKKFCEKQFLKMYSGQTILKTLTTLKASTTFSGENCDAGTEKIKRLKVIEAAKSYIESDKIYMFEIVGDALKRLYSDQGLYIDLFKKNQHGGLREIYILNIYSRVVQHCIETMSRSLCQIFDSETMTNPSNKTKLITAHKQKVKNRFSNMETLTHCTSDDAKKWNQGHYAAKFALMLCRLMPTEYHGLIRSICFLWHKKRILIDDSLLRIFKKNPDAEWDEGPLGKMANIYMGNREGERWMKPGSRYIETRTGMMQGILHYTSSLLHTLHNEYLKMYFTNTIRSFILKEKETLLRDLEYDKSLHERYATPVITVMQSSDDSAMMISVPCSRKENHMTLSIIMETRFRFKALCGRLAGIYPSEKSASNTPGLMEFNSNWLFMNNKHNPYFKHVLACTNVSGQSTLVGRQQETYNYVTSIIEQGGSMLLAFFCMLCIGRLHYQMLGATMTHLFNNHYKKTLIKLKLPSLGYFLMDNMMLAGLAGWDYLHWNLCSTTTVGDYYYLLFETNKRAEKMNFDDLKEKALILDNATAGLFSAVTNLKFGMNYKLQRLKMQFNLPLDWLEELNENPEPILRTPKNEHEKMLNIAAKLHGPGMQESFNDVDCTSSVAGAAGYHLKFACYFVDSSILVDSLTPGTQQTITDQQAWSLEEDEEGNQEKLRELMLEKSKRLQKYSLMSILTRTANLSKEIRENPNLDERYLSDKSDFITRIFSKESDYKTIRDHMSSSPVLDLHKDDKNLLNKVSIVNVTSKDYQQFKAPYDLCLIKWFSIGSMDRRTHAFLWKNLISRYPWIKETYKETMMASPFTDCIQLFNFLSRLDKNDRRVHMLSIPVTSSMVKSDLEVLMNSNLWHGHSTIRNLDGAQREKIINDSINLRNLAHNLYMVESFPLHEDYKKNVIAKLLTNDKSHKADVKSQRLKRLAILCKFIQGKDEREIVDDIMKCSIGVLGSYTRRQYYDKKNKRYTGLGVWEGFIDTCHIKIIVNSANNGDTNLMKVVLSKAIDQSTLLYFLKDWCETNNVLNGTVFNWDDYFKAFFNANRNLIVDSKDIRKQDYREKIIFGFTNFNMIILSSGLSPYCPVYLNESYRCPAYADATGKLNLDYSKGVLRLHYIDDKNFIPQEVGMISNNIRGSLKKNTRLYTMVSHNINYRDFAQRFVNRTSFNIADYSSSERSVLSCWMSCETYPLESCLQLFDSIANSEDHKMPVDEDGLKSLVNGLFKSWVENRHSFKHFEDLDLSDCKEDLEIEDMDLNLNNEDLFDAVTASVTSFLQTYNIDDFGVTDFSEGEDHFIEGVNTEDYLFGDFVSQDKDEYQTKMSSVVFNELFEYLFGSIKSEKEIEELYVNGILPYRFYSRKALFEFILNKKLTCNPNISSRSEADKHFPIL